MTATAEDEEPVVIGKDSCGTRAVVEIGSGGTAVGMVVEGRGGVVVEGSGGTVVEGGWIDMAKSDTRLICCCSLPRTDRRLYEWTIGGRGLKADRRRGASGEARGRREVAARLGLPTPFRKPETNMFLLNSK
jgi:hypothetical protein